MKMTRTVLTLLIGLLMISACTCQRAKSNQRVLISTDCGTTYREIPAGDRIPAGTLDYCYIKVIIPNFSMQGASNFVGNFKDRVRAKIQIDYDYSITNGVQFMKQAKRLGNMNQDADSPEAIGTAFESAENSVIDVRIRDVVKAVILSEDIVDVDQAELENVIKAKTNEVLKDKGVELNFITLTFDLDVQTRQAIDVATAMRIYDSKGMGDIGKLTELAHHRSISKTILLLNH
jgi:hypothetical protein